MTDWTLLSLYFIATIATVVTVGYKLESVLMGLFSGAMLFAVLANLTFAVCGAQCF